MSQVTYRMVVWSDNRVQTHNQPARKASSRSPTQSRGHTHVMVTVTLEELGARVHIGTTSTDS